MTVKQLRAMYLNYLVTVPSITSSASTYGTLISSVPFDYIDMVMDKWKVKSSNEEYIVGHPGTMNECAPRTYYLWQYYVNHIQPIIKAGGTFDYLQLVVDFIDDGDILYALTIVDIVTGISELANRYFQEYNASMTTPISFPLNPPSKTTYFHDCRYALRLLRDCLQLEKSFVQNVNPHSSLNSERNKIRRELVYKIDGAFALAKEIGVDNFIQYAIDQCYFFEPYIVMQRMSEIVTDYTKGFNLYARKSENTSIQIPDGDSNTNSTRRNTLNKERASRGQSQIKSYVNKPLKFAKFNDVAPYAATNYPIVKDGDGNRALREDVIEYKTGYTISSGKESIFQNYRISHVWGRAFDPRFFTNLWNVVLVPAWANDLLDKPNPVKGSLESRLKSTIQRICEVLYFGGITNWSSINIPQPSVINGGNDVLRPKSMANDVAPKINKENATKSKNAPKNPYLINIIKGKGSKTLGDIVKYAVYI